MSIQAVPNVAALNAFLSTAPGQLHVLDFWASWCGPCTAIAPVYAALAKQYPGVSFGKVDVDAATDVARAYVRSSPEPAPALTLAPEHLSDAHLCLCTSGTRPRGC